jgi:hypothetical protein
MTESGGKATSPLANPPPIAGATMTSPDPEFLYIFLPESLDPLNRGDKYEDPIADELDRLGIGEVSGGGSSLGEELPDGTRPIEFCGIDVDTIDLERARAALRALLPELGCLEGTQLHYTITGKPLQDEYDGAHWTLGRVRTMLHPGFGV